MDNTPGYELGNGGSIPSRGTNFRILSANLNLFNGWKKAYPVLFLNVQKENDMKRAKR